MAKEIEIEVTIPDSHRVKGVRTNGNTIIVVCEPEVNLHTIGFIDTNNIEDTEDECEEEDLHTSD